MSPNLYEILTHIELFEIKLFRSFTNNLFTRFHACPCPTFSLRSCITMRGGYYQVTVFLVTQKYKN